MNRYGGRIERRIECARGSDADVPHEVHIVTFPDEDSFARYRADADLDALAGLRACAIRKTVVWRGADLPPFANRPA
jgi:hypothetical protein